MMHLSKPSKLGGVLSLGLPPMKTCPNQGQVCYTCYAGLGMAQMTNVVCNLEENYAELLACRTAEGMAGKLLKAIPANIEYFRWLWSGDVFSHMFARAIVMVAKARPETKFWLPTRARWFIGMTIPENLIIRISSHAVNDFRMKVGNGSTVALPGVDVPAHVWGCPGECGVCRVCWDFPDALVVYSWHGSGAAQARLRKGLKNSVFSVARSDTFWGE